MVFDLLRLKSWNLVLSHIFHLSPSIISSGIDGKYCLHFHRLSSCPKCEFSNNAIENSHQRGIIVHGTHESLVENNVLYGVRGAGIYIEDGNEMANSIKYNVVVCPWSLAHPTLHGCTVPGTVSYFCKSMQEMSTK